MKERPPHPQDHGGAVGPEEFGERLAADDGRERLWLSLALVLGALAGAGFLVMAFRNPGGVQDDARMFLSWMGRWDDPGLLPGDLVADYWHSVSPWFYRELFHAAWWIGIEPLIFVKVLPALLYPVIALFSFRFLRAMETRPSIACLATAAVVFYFTRDGAVVSGTPRALWPALLPMILDGLARTRIPQAALGQLLLSGCYPQLALVTATTIGMTLLAPSRSLMLDLTRRRLVLVAACAAATIAGVLPFMLDSGRFGPVANLAEARQMPTFGATGRNRIFEPDGSLNFLCGSRVGLLGSKCKGPSNGRFPFLALVAVAGPVILFLRTLRRGPAGRMRSRLPLYLLIGSLAWFAASALVLFRLHLPSRYTSALILLTLVTSLPLLLEWLRSRFLRTGWIDRARPRAVLNAGAVALAALAAFGVANARSVIRSPSDADLMAFLRSLPHDAVVAGFVADLDFSPVLTRRPTLFSRELAISYQLGYFRPVMQRMEDMRDVVLTQDPAVLAERLARNRVDVLLVPRGILLRPAIPDAFRGFFGADLTAAEQRAAAGGQTALARIAAECTIGSFSDVEALDGACLMTAGTDMARQGG